MCSLVVVSQLSSNVKAVYKNTCTRFDYDVTKDIWPPDQPKEYIPLVLLYHEDERNRPRLHSHDELGEALKASKATTDISEIVAPLEVSDKAQTILIEGAPGIGKTILLKHIAYSWAEQRMLQKYNLVLLVHLRDPTV